MSGAVAGNAQPPGHVRAAVMDRDADFAAFEKLPAALRAAIQDAPFEISAASIYEVWLRAQVRVGVGQALTYTLGLLARANADALSSEGARG